jgi:hypothetical protein
MIGGLKMARYWTLQEAQKLVNNQVKRGTIFARKDFPWVQARGKAWMLECNYSCLDAYSEDQKIVFGGLLLTVWAGSMRSATRKLRRGENLKAAHAALLTEARSQCSHTEGRELGSAECREKGIQHFGNCWHIYECGKCHDFYSVDSSD